MSAPALVVWATYWREPADLMRFSGEIKRVGAHRYRLLDGPSDNSEFGTQSLLPAAGPELVDVVLGPDPVPELAALLTVHDPSTLVVGGDVAALMAGLAGGTHLRVGSPDARGDGSLRHEVQLVARAVGLARLAGRFPL